MLLPNPGLALLEGPITHERQAIILVHIGGLELKASLYRAPLRAPSVLGHAIFSIETSVHLAYFRSRQQEETLTTSAAPHCGKAVEGSGPR